MFDVLGNAVAAPVQVFEPLGDRVLILPIEEGDRMAGGLLVKPDIAKEAPQTGRVVAVGPGRTTDEGVTIPMAVAVGDVVLFGKYSGTRITLNEVEHLAIRQGDVLGRLRESE